MIFPRGFTGHFDSKSEIVSPIDLAGFKSVCFAAARQLGGKVVGLEVANVTPNFHCATLEWGQASRQVSVLCNRHYWIVGLSKPRLPGECITEYVDAPELASVLCQLSDWLVVAKTELEAAVSEEMLRSMHPDDRQAIESARRQGWFTPAGTVGDVLFHHWD